MEFINLFRYSFKERYRTFLLELIKQKLGRGTTIGSSGSTGTEDERVFEAFLLVEDIMRYRHNIKILMLDDLSDDEIPECIVELLLTHFENRPKNGTGSVLSKLQDEFKHKIPISHVINKIYIKIFFQDKLNS